MFICLYCKLNCHLIHGLGNNGVTSLDSHVVHVSPAMRKPDFCPCKNKGASQLRSYSQLCSNCEADQRLCFRYKASTIPLLLKYEISSVYPSSDAAQTGLCQTWLETLKTGFLALRLICLCYKSFKKCL